MYFFDGFRKMLDKLQATIVTLRQEFSLMTRFLIASRKGSDMDMPSLLGTQEFSNSTVIIYT